jgi:long-chain acyl-CoA synthetase
MAVASTLIGIFLDAVDTRRRPDQFMRKTEHGWEAISSERALADVEALALALAELGVTRGERVALLAENRYEWVITDLAVLGLGAVTVPIYPTLTTAQVRGLLENCEPRLIVVSTAAQLDKARAASEGLSCICARIVMDARPPGGPSPEKTIAALLERGATLRAAAPGRFRELAAAVGPDDLATIIYTSGTTGEPKGAMLTHGNIASDVAGSLQVLRYQAPDRYLSFLPLCHIFERMAGLYTTLACGACIIYAQNFESVAVDALEMRPTILSGVPRFFEKVHARVMAAGAAHPPALRALFAWGLAVGRARAEARFARRALPPQVALQLPLADWLVLSRIRARMGGRLRFCVSGSAPLSPAVIEFFFAIGIPVIEGYGLTETSPVISFNPLGREKPGTVGPPIPCVEVRIGAEGEILTRGPHVMKGYYRNEAATREALRDGWFHTGDIGHLDADGYLVITDRLKDLLVLAGGKKVAPQPLEKELKLSPWICEVVLLGDRRPYVVALIVPDFAALEAEARTRGWHAPTRRSLVERAEVRTIYQAEIEKLNAERAGYEQVKRFTLLDRELSQEAGELTPTLKVKRKAILEHFSPAIDELYAGHAASPAA